MENSLDYNRLYEYRFRGVDQAARQRVWEVISVFIHQKMGSPKIVLDPAAGRCEFINSLQGTRERWVVDVVNTPEAYKKPDVKFLMGDILSVELPQGHFDGIFLSNFLEHLPSPQHVGHFFNRMVGCLKPGGKMAILGPNFKYCSSEYFDCVDHVLALTHVSISEFIYQAGLEEELVYKKFLPFSFRGILPSSASLTRCYLKMPILWNLLGKQFLMVARKPH